MADEAKGFPWVWLLVAAVVLYFLAKKATAAAAHVGKDTGYGIGKGAVDAAIDKATSPGALSALGSFVGGLFGSDKKDSAAWSDDQPPQSTVGYDAGEDFDEWSSGFFGPGL